MKHLACWAVLAALSVSVGAAASALETSCAVEEIPCQATSDTAQNRACDGDPNFKFAYVTNPNAGELMVVNRHTGDLVKTIAVAQGAAGVAVTPDGKQVWVIGNAEIDAIDTATNRVVGRIPFSQFGDGTFPNSIVVSPDCKRVYAINGQLQTDLGFGGVMVIDRATVTLLKTIQVGNDPRSIAISPDGKRLAVTNADDGTVSIVDPQTGTTLHAVAALGTTQVPAITPDGKFIYAVYGANDGVLVVDTATGVLVANIVIAGGACAPFGIAITPNGRSAYVTCQDSGAVKVIDTATNTVVQSFTPGASAFAVTIGPAGKLVYVVENGDTILAIDTKTNAVVSTIPLPGSYGIAVRPLP